MNFKAKALAAALTLGVSSGVMAQNSDDINITYQAADSAGLILNITTVGDVALNQGDGTGSFSFCVASLAAPAAYSIEVASANNMFLEDTGAGSDTMSYEATIDGDTTNSILLVNGNGQLNQDEISILASATCSTDQYTINIDADETDAIAGISYADNIVLTLTSD